MSLWLLLCLTFLSCFTPSSARHIININSTIIEFSSLAWNPITQHFVAGSTQGPNIYAVPDAGIVRCVISESSFNNSNNNNNNASVSALAVDNTRLRLIAAFSNPSSVAAYDLKSYVRVFAIPLPELEGVPGGVAMDEESGEIFVSSATKGVVLKLGSEGDKRIRVISEVEISGDQGFGGLVYINNGYFIIAQPAKGELLRVNSTDGTSTAVSFKHSILKPLPAGGHSIVLRSNFSAVVASDRVFTSMKSDKTWKHGKIYDEVDLKKHATAVGLARREAAIYALVKSPKGWKIQEVVFSNEKYDIICICAAVVVVTLCMGYGWWEFCCLLRRDYAMIMAQSNVPNNHRGTLFY